MPTTHPVSRAEGGSRTHRRPVLSRARYASSLHSRMVRHLGLEPRTCGLRVRCSNHCASGAYFPPELHDLRAEIIINQAARYAHQRDGRGLERGRYPLAGVDVHRFPAPGARGERQADICMSATRHTSRIADRGTWPGYRRMERAAGVEPRCQGGGLVPVPFGHVRTWYNRGSP